MAQLIKISELNTIPSVTGPELIPIVQGGVTDKILFSTLKNNIVATAQGLINTAVAALELEDVAINGLIDDTNTIVSGHTVTINSHTITIGDHTTSIGTLTNDVAALEAEDIAINGLIDDINTAIAVLPDTLYTGSGTLFDTGVATSRRFSFITDQDVIYNPTGGQFDLKFNHYFNNISSSSAQPGSLGIRTKTNGDSRYVIFNMFAPTPEIELRGYNNSVGRERLINVTSLGVNLSTETPTGTIVFYLSDSGAIVTDGRVTKKGLEYFADYNSELLLNDRSIPDVEGVKTLRQQANTWTTAGRPTPATGVFGFNTTTSKFEGYNGTTWVDFA